MEQDNFSELMNKFRKMAMYLKISRIFLIISTQIKIPVILPIIIQIILQKAVQMIVIIALI